MLVETFYAIHFSEECVSCITLALLVKCTDTSSTKLYQVSSSIPATSVCADDPSLADCNSAVCSK